MSFDDGLMVGLMLGGGSGGSGDTTAGKLRRVADSSGAPLAITAETTDSSTGELISETATFTYVKQTFSDSVTTTSTGADGTSVSATSSFSADVIAVLRNSANATILAAVFADGDTTGKVDHYTDFCGDTVYYERTGG